MNITQSLIKEIGRDHCPRKLYERYFLRKQVEESKAVFESGIFFEQITTFYCFDEPGILMKIMYDYLNHLQVNEFDVEATALIYYNALQNLFNPIQVPESLLKKQTKKPKYGTDRWTVELYRIYYQAYMMYQDFKAFRLFDHPVIPHERRLIEWDKDNDVILSGEYDLSGKLYLQNDDGSYSYHDCIIDIKLTGSVRNEFGPFCWGAPHLMDHTQPKMYMKMAGLINRTLGIDKIPMFMYFVSDTKPTPERSKIKKSYTQLDDYEINESIRSTYQKVLEYQFTEWPEIPGFNQCKNCLLKADCKAYQLNPPSPKIFNIE